MVNVFTILMPKGKGTKGGKAFTPQFNPNQPLLALPTYNQHLVDIFDSRTANNANTLLEDLVNHDPDVSSAVHSFLTIGASSTPVIYAYDLNNQLDTAGIEIAQQLLVALTNVFDYTQGFSRKPTLNGLANNLRYMFLLRGSSAVELVLDKTYVPTELRLIDTATLRFRQTAPGVFQPYQKPPSSVAPIELNIPTFFHEVFHQSPMDVHTYSPFVSAINTIAARQDVINELYRIMKIVGYPRLDVQVVEDVLLRNAPASLRADPEQMRKYVDTQLNSIRSVVSGLKADQAFIHSDAVEARIINDKNPGTGIQIQNVIDVLDAQNQAALKVMPAVVGKGSNGQVASTEARLFAMSADAMNRSVADILTKSLTFAARLGGYQGRIVVVFPTIELRPTLELEPQKIMKSSRLKQDLSLGLITDDEYHLELYGRPKPASAPQLSGTGFLTNNTGAAAVDATSVSPNSDPLGKSLAPPGGNKAAKSNAVKSGSVKPSSSSKPTAPGKAG